MLLLGKRYSDKEMGPQVLLRDLEGIKIGACKNATIAKEF
jgi:hypothetical protein